jgi:hypothetical protein
MVQDRENPVLPEVGHQFANVVPQFLNLPVLLFGDVEDAQVNLDAIIGKGGCDFATNNDIGMVRNLERSIDGVMIGYGDKVHTPRLCAAIHFLRRAVGLFQKLTDEAIAYGLGEDSMDVCVKSQSFLPRGGGIRFRSGANVCYKNRFYELTVRDNLMKLR